MKHKKTMDELTKDFDKFIKDKEENVDNKDDFYKLIKKSTDKKGNLKDSKK